LLIAFVIQLPFLILMSFAGVHSALGGAWVIFYLPAILLLDKIASTTPGTAPFFETVVIVAIQELILLAVIFPVMALYIHVRRGKKAERLSESPQKIQSS
jgi:uncharacterized membrane protein YhaH (DUF805 family)